MFVFNYFSAAQTHGLKDGNFGFAKGITNGLTIANGLCLRATGDTIICAPPFVLSHGEADELIDKTLLTLEQTHEALAP